ncbi:MAG: FHA domain-containing protein [Bdellovibrionales bacterium]|nr:FHA domain-containing protein [Bdellovibrionales bacterium]
MAREVIANILVTQADGKEERYVLRDQEELRIGREETNDIMISEAGVSRFHASLAASTSGVVLSDLASLNGTFVNGLKLSGMRDVSSSDSVQVGGARIRLELASDVVGGNPRSTRARAMTAQMKPVSVSVLVLRLGKEGESDSTLEKSVLTSWIESVKNIVTEFDGSIDKRIGNIVVSLWVGDDARNQALRALRTYQRVQESTDASAPDCRVYAALASGIGLQGAAGADSSGKRFNIVGDPVNIAFSVAELHGETGYPVLIDKTTGEHIKEQVDLAPVGKLREFPDPLFTIVSL